MRYVINNTTSFDAGTIITQDKSVVTIVKVTCRFSPDGRVEIAEEQKPIVYGDEYRGDPVKSSLKYASDAVPEKKTSDIALIGHAYAPDKVPVSRILTSLQAGNLHRIVWVTGDRFWKWSAIGISKTKPILFQKMPLVYERSFGGQDCFHKNKKNTAFVWKTLLVPVL